MGPWNKLVYFNTTTNTKNIKYFLCAIYSSYAVTTYFNFTTCFQLAISVGTP